MLSPSQYESLLEAMEDLEDISAFDAAVARNESANVYQSQLIYFQRIQSRQNQKKLVGREGYRIRVGDFRIIYVIRNNVLAVLVIEISHRRVVHRRYV